jgi:predicted nucleic acid-binding Zn ribbon protein
MAHIEDNDEDLAEADWPEEDDQDSGDLKPCPYCRKPVYEQAEVCPHCGSFISDEDAPRHKSLWMVIGVAICILLILLTWVL